MRRGIVRAGSAAPGFLREALDAEIRAYGQEAAEVLLRYGHLSTVDEVEHQPQVGDANSSQEDDRMVVVEEDFPPEQITEDGAGGGEDDLVGVDLGILTCEGDVKMVSIISQPLEKGLDVSFVIVPCKSVVFRAHGFVGVTARAGTSQHPDVRSSTVCVSETLVTETLVLRIGSEKSVGIDDCKFKFHLT